MAISLGGGSNQSNSNYFNNSSANLQQQVWDIQNPAYAYMYGQMPSIFQNTMWPYMNLGMNRMGQATDFANRGASLGHAQSQYFGRGGGYGDTSKMRNQTQQAILQSMQNPSEVGRMYESIVGGKGNSYVDPLVSSMWNSANEQLDRTRAGNALEATAMGQGGSNRHAMENAMANRRITQDTMNNELALRAGAYDTDLNWKMGIAQQADAGRAAAQQRGLDFINAGDANRQYAMNYQPTLQNMGMNLMAPTMQHFMMPYNMMNQYAGVLGDPLALMNANAQSQGGGSSSSSGRGFNFGAGGLT